jgi:hypothetical protein
MVVSRTFADQLSVVIPAPAGMTESESPDFIQTMRAMARIVSSP